MGSFSGFLETVYDVLFAPRQAFRLIVERRLVGQALFLVFLGLLLPPWAVYDGAKAFMDFPYAWAAFAVICFVFWFLGAAVLSIIAELFGGKGSAAGLFAAMGFTVLPRIVVMPLWVAVAFLPEQLKFIATGLIATIVLAWTFFLILEAICASHNVNTNKALLTVFTSVLLVASTFAAVIIFSGAALFEANFK